MDCEFVFEVLHGSTTSPHDVGAVAVIDGSESYVLLIFAQSSCLTIYRKLKADAAEAVRCAAAYGSQ